MRRPSSACQSQWSAQRITSPTASANGLPWSSVMLRPISWARARLSSATLRKMALRSIGETVRQRSKARCAAASARAGWGRLAGGGEWGGGVCGAGVRQAAEPLPRGRVEHVLLDAAVALEKLAVDVKGKRFVHECLRRGTRIYLFARTC